MDQQSIALRRLQKKVQVGLPVLCIEAEGMPTMTLLHQVIASAG
jgi:hypothetical protein